MIFQKQFLKTQNSGRVKLFNSQNSGLNLKINQNFNTKNNQNNNSGQIKNQKYLVVRKEQLFSPYNLRQNKSNFRLVEKIQVYAVEKILKKYFYKVKTN